MRESAMDTPDAHYQSNFERYERLASPSSQAREVKEREENATYRFSSR